MKRLTVDSWNEKHSVGEDVFTIDDFGRLSLTKTTSKAYMKLPAMLGFSPEHIDVSDRKKNHPLGMVAPFDEIKVLDSEDEDLTLKDIIDTNPRAWKLMKKQKGFIVIAEDEDYFMPVYYLIRMSEKKKGTWTEEDEDSFLIAYYDHEKKGKR